MPNSFAVGSSLGDVVTPGASISLQDMGALDVVLTDVPSWPVLPSPSTHGLEIPAMNGGYGYVGQYEPVELTLKCFVGAKSVAGVREKIDAIAAVLDSRKGDRVWKVDAWPDRYFVGMVWKGVGGTDISGSGADFEIVVRLSQAFGFGVTPKEKTFFLQESPRVCAVDAVGGTAEALPVWTICNVSTSPTDAVVLRHADTGEVVCMVDGLAAGEWVRFDRFRQCLETSMDGETWVKDMRRLGAWVDIPELTPGSNSIEVSGVPSGALVCWYRERYL